MIRKILLPLLALCGVMFAIYSVMMTNRPPPPRQPVVRASLGTLCWRMSPGQGLWKPARRTLRLGRLCRAWCTEVWCQVGSRVKAGEPLFKLDGRDLQAELLVRQAAFQTEQENLTRLTSFATDRGIAGQPKRACKEAEAALAISNVNSPWRRALRTNGRSVARTSTAATSRCRWPRPNWPKHGRNWRCSRPGRGSRM